MTKFKIAALLGLALILSACADLQSVTRGAPFEQTPDATVPAPGAMALQTTELPALVDDMHVDRIRIYVPDKLQVSEANSYMPAADIVWRGDPVGDRHKQVEALFQEGFRKGTADLKGKKPVSIYVEVFRFHGVTERTRYSVGGVHVIRFGLAVHDLTTGELIGEPRIIHADLPEPGGAAALAADAKGQTQKVRVTDHLAHVIRQELTRPGSYVNEDLGIVQVLHKRF